MSTATTIQRYYQTLLNRTGSLAEVSGWVDLVDNSGIPLEQVQASFINSFEALHNVAPIIEMYQAHLGRVPDPAGLAQWVGNLASGAMTLAQIGLAFASSAESQAYYGTTFDANFVTLLYERVLGREPEPGIVTFWLAARDNGLTQAQLQEGFRTSLEAGTRAAPAVTNFLTEVAQSDPNAYTGSLYSLGRTITLTTGYDYGAAFTGTSGNNTFLAVEDTTSGSPIPVWTTSDAINGGAGTNTFNVTQTAPISGAPLNATVTNIQTANIVDASTVTLNTTGWTGLTALNVTDNGATSLTAAGTTGVTVNDTAGNVTIAGGSTQTVSTSAGTVALSGATGAIVVTDSALGAGTITINGGTSVSVTATGEVNPSGNVVLIGRTAAPTGPVTVNVSSDPTATANRTLGTIMVMGGSAVNVTQNVLGAVNHTFAAGLISVEGTAATTSVSTSATAAATANGSTTGVVKNAVQVTDVNGGSSTLAGTITSVSARNFTTLSINDNALTTLSVAGGSGNMIIDNSGLTTSTNRTLALTIDGQTGGTLDDADIYTTLNVTTANNNSTLANITSASTTALTVAGINRLTLTSAAGLSALQTVRVSGSAGLIADLSSSGTLTSVDTSTTTGTTITTINGARTTFDGGAGVDVVTMVTGATNAISLGDGDDTLVIRSLAPSAPLSGGAGIDTLSIDATSAATASGSSTFAGRVTGFEKLIVTGATNQTIDVGALGIADAVLTNGGNGLTLSNLANGGTLTLTGAGTAYTASRSPSPDTQTLNLLLTDGSTAGVAFASTGITAANVQTIAITTADTQATPSGSFNDAVTLLGNASRTITVAGNAGLSLTATSTGLTTVDASAITLGGFAYTSGVLASAAVIKGSSAATNTVDFSAATAVVTYTGGSGTDAITANNARANVIDVGGGNNSIVAGSGANTLTSGAGNDFIVVGNGNNTINTGSGNDVVTTGSGINTITMGTGAKTLILGQGSNTVTLGAHSTSTPNTISVGPTPNGSFLPTAIITGLNTVGSDTIRFMGDTATSFISFMDSQLISFGDALGNNAVPGSPPLTLAAAVADVLASNGGNLAQHGIGAFTYTGNTYLVEQFNTRGSAFGASDTLIELRGIQTFGTPSVSSGLLLLA